MSITAAAAAAGAGGKPLVVEPGASPGVNTYLSDLYTVEVLSSSGAWLPSYTYKYSRSSVSHWHQNATPSVSFTTFGTSRRAQVRISQTSGSITSVAVSPKRTGIPTQITGGKVILTLGRNDKAWVTIDGDDAGPLFIFADWLKPAVPAGATYFGPGIHTMAPETSNHYHASDNEVIYLDSGAWVKGNFNVIGQ